MKGMSHLSGPIRETLAPVRLSSRINTNEITQTTRPLSLSLSLLFGYEIALDA